MCCPAASTCPVLASSVTRVHSTLLLCHPHQRSAACPPSPYSTEQQEHRHSRAVANNAHTAAYYAGPAASRMSAADWLCSCAAAQQHNAMHSHLVRCACCCEHMLGVQAFCTCRWWAGNVHGVGRTAAAGSSSATHWKMGSMICTLRIDTWSTGSAETHQMKHSKCEQEDCWKSW
jgi:hypothetical protein